MKAGYQQVTQVGKLPSAAKPGKSATLAFSREPPASARQRIAVNPGHTQVARNAGMTVGRRQNMSHVTPRGGKGR
jgi:hypothetical protein